MMLSTVYTEFKKRRKFEHYVRMFISVISNCYIFYNIKLISRAGSCYTTFIINNATNTDSKTNIVNPYLCSVVNNS